MFPILLAVNSLYGEGDKPTKFGKSLFIGMAYAAGAGSVITFLGSARAAAGAGMFAEFTGKTIGFFELTKFTFLIGWAMVFLIWVYLIIFMKPEKSVIPGLRERVTKLAKELGPMTRDEKFVIITVLGAIAVMSMQSFVPALKSLDRAAIMLVSTLLFFIFKVLTVKELEDIPVEHHPALQRSHEHRFLSLADRRSTVDGSSVARHVPERPLAGICSQHRNLCPYHDELHYERCGYCHFTPCFTCYRTVPSA